MATEYSEYPPPLDERRTWFQLVFQHEADRVWRTLLSFGVRESDVEDASQEVFLVLYRDLDDLLPHVSANTYLYAVCRRKASDLRKRQNRNRESPMLSLPDPPVRPMQGGSALFRDLQRVLDGLEARQREVWVLHEIEQLGMSEIVKIVGGPVQTGYSRLHAARRAIEAAFRGDTVDDTVSDRLEAR